jgi:hypothetical protein
VTGEAPPSCFCLEEDDDEEVSWVGPWWLACWASADGLRSGKSLFFWFFLFPFSVFYFEILTNIGFLFLQGFEFMTLHKIPLIHYWYKMLY